MSRLPCSTVLLGCPMSSALTLWALEWHPSHWVRRVCLLVCLPNSMTSFVKTGLLSASFLKLVAGIPPLCAVLETAVWVWEALGLVSCVDPVLFLGSLFLQGLRSGSLGKCERLSSSCGSHPRKVVFLWVSAYKALLILGTRIVTEIRISGPSLHLSSANDLQGTVTLHGKFQ